MNISVLHLNSFNPFIKEKKDNIVDQVYFFGVNILELIYDTETNNIIKLILNGDVVDYNDTVKIEKLNSHLDKCHEENMDENFKYEYKIHITGINVMTRETDGGMIDYFTVKDDAYEIMYDKDTYEIIQILINGVETPLNVREDLDKINSKIDQFRFENWLNLEKLNSR